jgi:RNA polymerase sigma-70 factor, ECF subfamily
MSTATLTAPRREGAHAGVEADRPGVGPDGDLGRLTTRAAAGDPDAFGEIYTRFVEPVYRYVARRVGWHHPTAEDVTGDVFVAALRGMRHTDWGQGRDLGAWLFTIAHHTVASHHRSARVRRERPYPDPADHNPVEDHTDRVATSAVLYAAVRRLAPDDQEVVALRYLLDLTVAETAAVLGVPEGTVKSRTNRVMAELRRILPADVSARGVAA